MACLNDVLHYLFLVPTFPLRLHVFERARPLTFMVLTIPPCLYTKFSAFLPCGCGAATCASGWMVQLYMRAAARVGCGRTEVPVLGRAPVRRTPYYSTYAMFSSGPDRPGERGCLLVTPMLTPKALEPGSEPDIY